MSEDRREVLPGLWYYAVHCHGCGAPIPVFHDPSMGKKPFEGPETLDLQCPRCGHESPYGKVEFIAAQAVQAH